MTINEKTLTQKLADIFFQNVDYKMLYDPEGHNPEFGDTPKHLPTMRTAWVLKKEPNEILMKMFEAVKANNTNT